MMRIKYPIGIQTFSEIIKNDYIYVDKTQYIYNLINNSKYVFLSRPRRFGKSLLLSTIEAYFSGKLKLFKGLAISQYEHDWQEYPVLHLDFTGRDYNLPDSMEKNLIETIEGWETKYNCSNPSSDISERFRNIILSANRITGRQVVILIDEYDKPLLETVDNSPLQTQFRNTLRSFYGNLKRMDPYIKFAILTGITRFGHLSIFSDLNNLNDISMDEEYAAICGITSDELHRYFADGVNLLAQRKKYSEDQAYEDLRKNYDGYHFSPENCPDIYNPFSVLNALDKKRISNYWYRTGTPTFLLKLIKSGHYRLSTFNDIEISADAVENVSLDIASSLIPVLYQAGYLTIKGYREDVDMLKLGFPNQEVEKGFLTQLLQLYIPAQELDTTFSLTAFYDDAATGNIESFMQRMQSFFADMSYDSFTMLALEQHYQDVTYALFKLLGFVTNVEYKTASGRIDLVIKTSKYIYVFEFKMDKSAREALAQIDSKQYLLPFKSDGRKIVKIGANFSSELRTLDEWVFSFGE